MNSEQQQAASHTRHPYQAATSIIHIEHPAAMLPASRLLPAASKQPGKQPQQAATASSHSKQPQHQ
tara:strand:- start:182 stop:379 length:198 start_codon:yes stop_codon:yes gene_type:complete